MDEGNREHLLHDEVLTLDEAADLLKVKKEWLYRRTSRREIPHLKLGRMLRFWRSELVAWAQGHRPEVEGADAERTEEAPDDALVGVGE